MISFTDSLTHRGSRQNLIGADPTADDILFFSNELQVDPSTPPAFLVHAIDDHDVTIGNSKAYLQALIRYRIRAELYSFEKGGHGFGMHNPTSPVKWMDLLRNWLRKSRFL